MTFSKEDKSAWSNSEVMLELEKLAKENDLLSEPSKELYEPIEIEDNDKWEDEDLEDFKKALSDFEEPSFEKELHIAYDKKLFSTLEKIASDFANKSNIKVAYRIESTLNKLKNEV